jgi:magnesium transporter
VGRVGGASVHGRRDDPLVKVLHELDRAEIERLLTAREFFWVDLDSPTPEEIDECGRIFGLHPLAVEDSKEMGQRPKLDEYGDKALLVFYGVEDTRLVEVHVHLSGDWILTLHRMPCSHLLGAKGRLEWEPARTEEEAIYRVLDALTDSFFPLLDHIDEEIDSLMDAMIERPEPGQRQQLFTLRRTLVDMRRVVGPQRDVMARGGDILERLPGLEADEARDWFRDVYDHLLRIAEQIDAYRDLLSGALDVYLSTVQNRLSQVTKQLTLVATIFLPLTFVTGFFGQNFGWLVKHISTWQAFVGYGVGSMALSAALLYFWFQRSGFFDE